ncbi:MAG: Gmad2 immunoglobulin-like domain-containing protein [bacterium]|nr:Gmad2 immunoglobulin-like domain-containing protein [bacterium]
MKKILLIIIVIMVLIAGGLGAWWTLGKKEVAPVTNTEYFGNELEKKDLIRITSPRPNQAIRSPLTITGEARGYWFFEASFPVVLTDWDGLIIGQGIAQAKSDWMVTDFVPFEATLTFTADKNAYSNRGTLILRKDNPSGLSEHDDALEIPVELQ